MKRLAAASFLFIFLAANTVFGELIKLPALFHHYILHSELEKDISFFDFLKGHYTDAAHCPDGTHHQHEKLPFKSADSHTSQTVSIAPLFPYPISKTLYAKVDKIIPACQQNNYSNNYLSQIWQPPRIS